MHEKLIPCLYQTPSYILILARRRNAIDVLVLFQKLFLFAKLEYRHVCNVMCMTLYYI